MWVVNPSLSSLERECEETRRYVSIRARYEVGFCVSVVLHFTLILFSSQSQIERTSFRVSSQ
jgi:hypothetical protein